MTQTERKIGGGSVGAKKRRMTSNGENNSQYPTYSGVGQFKKSSAIYFNNNKQRKLMQE